MGEVTKGKKPTKVSSLYLIFICVIALSILWFGFSIHITRVMTMTNGSYFDNILGGKREAEKRRVIGYAVSITGCDDPTKVVDGAAVLKHSIHLSSIRHSTNVSRYDYHMYAFVHPIANDKCSSLLRNVGYDVYVRDTPFNISDIRNKKYQQWIKGASCCGEKEFLKLYAYTLTQHDLVVHLDTDVLVLQPLDDIYDIMLDNPSTETWKAARRRLPIMYNKSLPEQFTAMYTKDYNMAIPPVDPKFVVVQGGFYVVRPDVEVFNEMVNLVLEGNYEPSGGWGPGLGYGNCYGAAQIQGFYAYYFGHIHPNTSVELNRCYYNNMVDNPRSTIKNTPAYGKVMSAEKVPLDCRTIPISQIYSTHFTLCQKPWTCTSDRKLCGDLTRAWFETRQSLEKQWINDGLLKSIPRHVQERANNYPDSVHMGYCDNVSYMPMTIPSKIIK